MATVSESCYSVVEFIPVGDPFMTSASAAFVFDDGGLGPTIDTTKIDTALIAFYNSTATGAAQPMGAYLSPALSRATNAALITHYDLSGKLAGGALGGPVAQTKFTLTAAYAGSTPYTNGVCMALTHKAYYNTDTEYGPGTRPRSRDRGRIYFGPLASQAIDQTTGNVAPIVRATTRTDACAAMTALAAVNVASGSGIAAYWSVWSRKSGVAKTVVGGWVDERPDYQRKRERLAGHTTTWGNLS